MPVKFVLSEQKEELNSQHTKKLKRADNRFFITSKKLIIPEIFLEIKYYTENKRKLKKVSKESDFKNQECKTMKKLGRK